MKTARLFLALALLVSSVPANAFSQTATTSRITGIVTDANGGVVPGASIKLENKGTQAQRTAITNDEGRFVFPSLEPGDYAITVEARGFRKTTVSQVAAQVSKSINVDVTLEPGGASEQVTVTAAGEVQLAKDDASVGNVIDRDRIARLPTATRQATDLLNLQPGVTSGGEVTGARADQNTFNLDGIDVSDNVIGLPYRTVIPVPAESLDEFRVTVANPNATFGRSAGGQITFVTKRGTNQFHGSAYEYYQGAALNANTWDNNRIGLKRPPLVDNRFGISVGGPIWKDKAFFFLNYEGRRLPGTLKNTRIVPTDSLKNGILKFFDASGGIITVDPKTFDPRGIGANPQILSALRLMPAPNDNSAGDGLNTAGFTANFPQTLESDFAVLRLDYQLSSKWAISAKGAAQEAPQTGAFQVDLIHLKGAENNPSRPRNLVLAATGSIRPNLVNEFRYGYTVDNQLFDRISPTTVAGFNVAVDIAGANTSTFLLDQPIDVDTQRARKQSILSKVNQFLDNATWTKGTHTLQFGADFRRIGTFHFRDDKVVGSVSTPVAEIGSSGNVSIDPAERPAGLQPGDVARYNQLYAALLGIVDRVSYLAVRDANLKPLPVGTGLVNDTILHHWEFYFADVWKVKPSFTLSYGLLYQWHTPPTDSQGRQSVAIYKDSKELVDVNDYLRQKKAAAEQGDIFNPDLAYVPIKEAGRSGVFDINRKDFSPRVSAAWQPSFKDGWLGKAFGDRKTVIRGGYSLTYDRANTVATVIIPMLGVGFAQTLSVLGPKNKNGDPFRAGIDGNIPVPVNMAATSPIVPDKPFGELLSFLDNPRLLDPRNHSIDFTIQRELPWKMLVEVGYVGRLGRELYQSYNLNSNPYFFKDKKSGQIFSQAFDNVATQLRGGTAPDKVTAQPWFENQIGAGATGTLAGFATGDFISGNLNNIWNLGIDFFTPTPYNNQQALDLFFRANGGRSNYHALLVSLHKRASSGLTFDVNYTLSKSLDQVGAVQNSAGELASSFFPDLEYGPSFYDRTHVVNANWIYDLPFGRGRRFATGNWLDRLIGGWYLSGIYQVESGQPLQVSQNLSGQTFGGTVIFGYGTGAIPTAKVGTGNHDGVKGSNNIGTNATGKNIFGDPEKAYNSFRRALLSQDGRAGRGALRGLSKWQVDLSLGKQTKITEQVSFTLAFDFFNILNHPNFYDPNIVDFNANLENPSNFGVITTQITPNPNGFPLAYTFYRPRAIQLSGRIQF
ncbi:MAG TPA: carboxypeptidase regulatory-like domain-containing protein [Blastocatellia bacterium]|nr:carboxypeptidase regulatory-like domain-containing protein [Blastocatellia bacterium]